MKQYVRTFACWVALAIAGCGGKQTIASKSAAAYDEARKKGIPIEAGEHGGHSAGVATAANHRAMTGTDHSKMSGMQYGQSGAAAHDMGEMDHSKMAGMQHGKSGAATHSMAGMDHSKMSGMQHGQSGAATHDMAGMDHAAMPGMQHGATTAPALVIAPPTTNAAIAQTQPAATLRPDQFDAPAPAAIEEAAKAASGMSHSIVGSNQPEPPSGHDHHGDGATS